MISALLAGATVLGVFYLGWYLGSDDALTTAAKVNQSAMRILGVDWARYVEAIREAVRK